MYADEADKLKCKRKREILRKKYCITLMKEKGQRRDWQTRVEESKIYFKNFVFHKSFFPYFQWHHKIPITINVENISNRVKESSGFFCQLVNIEDSFQIGTFKLID